MQTTHAAMDEEYVEDTRGRRERSPAFPFISLEKAIARASEFAKEYRRFEARITNVGGQWGFRPKSSTALQTVAALKYFGLMEDTGGVKDERKVRLTDLARQILEDKRPGAYEKAVQEAALRPRVILEQWQKWGVERPPDPECVSDLHFDKDFTEEAAQRFLAVYDETILFAKLVQNATLFEEDSNKNSLGNELVIRQSNGLSPIQVDASEDELMEGERVVYTYEDPRSHNQVRIILRGEFNKKLLDAIAFYVNSEIEDQKSMPKPDTEMTAGVRSTTTPPPIDAQRPQP